MGLAYQFRGGLALRSEPDGALGHGVQTRNGLQQLTLAGTGDAGDAQNLTAQSGEGDVVQPLYALAIVAGDALQGQAGDGSVVLGAVDVQGHTVAHHHIRQGLRIRLGGLDGADILALAEDGHLVGQSHDLVELVGDDDDGLAVGLHVPQDGEELLRLLRGQHLSLIHISEPTRRS